MLLQVKGLEWFYFVNTHSLVSEKELWHLELSLHLYKSPLTEKNTELIVVEVVDQGKTPTELKTMTTKSIQVVPSVGEQRP